MRSNAQSLLFFNGVTPIRGQFAREQGEKGQHIKTCAAAARSAITSGAEIVFGLCGLPRRLTSQHLITSVGPC